jgi:spore germination cell wall hydrolase CwlJ-like protein
MEELVMRTNIVKLFTASIAALFLISLSGYTNESVGLNTPIEPVVVQATAIDIQPEPEPKPLYSSEDLECLALNIYHEARGETQKGKLAVAHVTVNRVAHRRFPDSVCGVVYQAVYSKWWRENHGREVPVRNMCQFSWFCDGKSDGTYDRRAWQESLLLAVSVLEQSTQDPTNGATHYFNPTLANPAWQHDFVQVAMVDSHLFYK